MATSSTLLTLQYIFLAVLVVAACSTQHGSTDDDKQGSGINSFILNRTKLPLSWDWGYQPPPKSCNGGSARECNPGCLDKKKVKGKIVVCDGNFHNYNPFDEALRAGAAGAIAVGKRNTSSIEPLPASTIRYDGGYTEMQLYFYSTK
ncbi:hypothetical protein LWI29_019613 [Acer saccharum]|uniref:PA domain-containing protein n=1 Tax=Acer saccharum TaxID=4024 RepID=A0AA39SBH1_ACESA|nr:hypothetical protein LWI29_019613 [Acer saccharum]